MSTSTPVKEERYPAPRNPNTNSPPTSKSFESSTFANSAPSNPQPTTSQAHASDKPNAEATTIYAIWPTDTLDESSKEQGDRIISAIKAITDKPEEIRKCLLGDNLVYAKASMTAAQAAVLQDHPDVSAHELSNRGDRD